MEKYDVIIGLEIHSELDTKSKMFCACNNDAEQAKPNTLVCPICLGHPGTLPVVNQAAVDMALTLGLALNCQINLFSKFDRKNYFYPDLPKGYQISQYDLPLAFNGSLTIDNEPIAITRLHLEEDTGKLSHPAEQNYSLADYNRAGTPLVELVTEPVIKNAHQAKEFCQKFQQILRYLRLSQADMEKGQMRCEANVSLQSKGTWTYQGQGIIKPTGDQPLNPKVEVKNINSFRALEKAINYEIERQTQLLDKNKPVVAETRGWNDKTNQTVSQRRKETSADYRYFPEPDLPPLQLDPKTLASLKKKIVELPDAKQQRFMDEYEFSAQDAELLVSDQALAGFAEEVISELRSWVEELGDDWQHCQRHLAKLTANWLGSELLKHLKLNKETIKDLKFSAENFAELIALVYENKINSSAGQIILNQMYQIGGDPSQIMEKMNLQQMDSSEELEAIVQKIINDNPRQTEAYKAGKTNLLQFFIGQTMAATKGKANPKVITELLQKILANHG